MSRAELSFKELPSRPLGDLSQEVLEAAVLGDAEHTMYSCRRARARPGESPKVVSTSGPLPSLLQSNLQARQAC